MTPPAATGRVFISYRRQETAYPAGWLYDRLVDHLGRDQVFKDIDSIQLGDDFVEVITRAVGSCDVLLALIGDAWLTVTDEDGHRRLDNPDDFVRLEIEAALARKVRVIPILVEGAGMPKAEQLPPSLSALARRQALELSPSRFDSDTSRLLRVLDRTLAEVQTGPTAPPPRPASSTTRVPVGPAADEPPDAPAREAPGEVAPSRPTATPGATSAREPRGAMDPTLGPEPTPPTPAAPPATRPGRAQVQRWLGQPIRLISAAAVVVITVIVIVVAQAQNRNGAATHHGQTPNVATVPAEARPANIAVGGGAIWVANTRHGTVSRIDPATRKVTPIKVGQTPSGVAVGEGAVWVANSGDDSVSRIDPATNKVVASIGVGPRPQNLAVGAGAVWVATGNNEGRRIDPADNQPGRYTAFGGSGGLSSGVAVGAGYVWVANNGDNTVSLVNPITGPELGWLRTTIPVGLRPQGVAVGAGYVWVANNGDNTVSRISATSRRRVATIRVGLRPQGVAVGAGAVWVANDGDDTISRIDPATGAVATIKIGSPP